VPKAIVFDFDGVVVDSEPLHYRAFLEVVRQYDVHFDYAQYLKQYVGFDDRDGFRAILSQRQPVERSIGCNDALIAALCQQKAEAFESIVAEGFEPIAGILEFIGHIQSQLPMAIASGATRADVKLLLGKLGLIEQFDPIVTADDVKRSKPDPASYQLAVAGLAKRIGQPTLAASDCLAIEDTPAGIDSAHQAGLKTLGLATTHSFRTLHRADRVIQSIKGINLHQLQDWYG